MQLRKRGLRPQLGDSVVIAKADDPRDGEEATVVQVKEPGAIPPISPYISLHLPQAIVQLVKQPGAIPPISPYISLYLPQAIVQLVKEPGAKDLAALHAAAARLSVPSPQP